jgi:hypothetical protein
MMSRMDQRRYALFPVQIELKNLALPAETTDVPVAVDVPAPCCELDTEEPAPVLPVPCPLPVVAEGAAGAAGVEAVDEGGTFVPCGAEGVGAVYGAVIPCPVTSNVTTVTQVGLPAGDERRVMLTGSPDPTFISGVST